VIGETKYFTGARRASLKISSRRARRIDLRQLGLKCILCNISIP
jgi:hypothetical protein